VIFSRVSSPIGSGAPGTVVTTYAADLAGSASAARSEERALPARALVSRGRSALVHGVLVLLTLAIAGKAV